MENDILFTETQKFRQWWIWLILIGVNGLSVFGLCKQFIDERQSGAKPGSTELLVITLAVLVFTILFIIFKLETIIRKDGVYVRFFPFHLKFKHYHWDTIIRSYVRHYSPLLEYGGWGLKFGLFGKGTAFNVSGDEGLQLEFLNHRKLLIGTNKPDELTQTLIKLGQFKP